MPQCLSGGDSSNRFKFPFGNLGLKCGNVLPPPSPFSFSFSAFYLNEILHCCFWGEKKRERKRKSKKGREGERLGRRKLAKKKCSDIDLKAVPLRHFSLG